MIEVEISVQMSRNACNATLVECRFRLSESRDEPSVYFVDSLGGRRINIHRSSKGMTDVQNVNENVFARRGIDVCICAR